MKRFTLSPAATADVEQIEAFLTDEPLRFYPVWSYLVVYRLTDPVEIARVVHGARDVARGLRRRRRS